MMKKVRLIGKHFVLHSHWFITTYLIIRLWCHAPKSALLCTMYYVSQTLLAVSITRKSGASSQSIALHCLVSICLYSELFYSLYCFVLSTVLYFLLLCILTWSLFLTSLYYTSNSSSFSKVNKCFSFSHLYFNNLPWWITSCKWQAMQIE